MAHDVFISYSSSDRVVADAVCAALEYVGVRCWLAPRNISPGEKWGAAINRAIKASRMVVLVYSGEANTSEYVEREIACAVAQRVPVLPFRIADVPPSDAMEYLLSTAHWLNATGAPVAGELKPLVAAVKVICAKAEGSRPEVERKPIGRAMDELAAEEPSPRARVLNVITPAPAGGSPGVESNGGTVADAPLPASPARTPVAAGTAREPTAVGQRGEPIQIFRGHNEGVGSVEFVPGTYRLLSGGGDGSLRGWNVPLGVSEWARNRHSGRVTAIACNGHVGASGSYESIAVWKTDSGRLLIPRVGGHTDWILGVAMDPAGDHLVSCGKDGTVRLWSLQSGRELRRFEGHTAEVLCVAFLASTRQVVTGSRDGSIRVWDAASGARIHVLQGHTKSVNCVRTFRLDGDELILSAGSDGAIRLWNPKLRTEPLKEFGGLERETTCLSWSPLARQFVSGGTDDIVILWDLAAGELRQFHGHSRGIDSVSITTDGTMAASAGGDGMIRIWSLSR